MPTEILDQHRRQPFANTLWLTRQNPRPSSVVTIGYEDGILTDAFTGMVDRLTCHTWGDVKHTHLPADDESVSLVVLETRVTESPPSSPRARALHALIRECARILEPGGTLMVVGESPFWFKRIPGSARRILLARGTRSIGHVAMGRWTRYMRRMGLSEIHTFLLTPAYTHPTHIIPTAGRAAAVHERVLDPSPRATLRRAIARFGGYSILYPGSLIVAEKP